MFFFSYFLSLSLSHTHTNTQPPTRPTWPTSGRAPAPDPGRSGRSGRPGPGRPEPEGLPAPGPGRSGWSVGQVGQSVSLILGFLATLATRVSQVQILAREIIIYFE